MKILITILFVAMLAVGFAWYNESKPISDTPTNEEQDEAPIEAPLVEVGNAQVDKISLVLLESFPVQVRATVVGSFADSCTGVGEITQEREAQLIRVRLSTVRPREALCAQVITPFEHIISIDAFGLPAGKYTVEVNGATDTFILDTDNGQPIELQ